MAAFQPRWFLAFLLTVAVLAGLLVVLDRATPGGPLPTPTPPPAPEVRTASPEIVEPNRRQSVVLVSLGGASADALSGWIADEAMPALSQVARRGWTVPLRSVSPPLPGPALAALTADRTTPDAEPIWQTAALHGRTTALLFWPGADPGLPDRRGDYALACAPPPTAAGQQTTTLSPADPWAGSPTSFSPPFAGALTFPSPLGAVRWHVLAIDTADDDRATYDTFFLAPEGDGQPIVDRNTRRLTLNAWGTLPISGPGLMLTVTDQRTLTRTGTLSPTVSVTPTATLTPTATPSPTVVIETPAPPVAVETTLELTLYQIAAQAVTARPAALGQEVIERFGFCPPLPDPRTVAQGQLSPAAFSQLASLRARWAMRAAAYVYETYRPHLLLIRQEALPASEQALLLADPRQAGYSPARAAELPGHRRAVARTMDDGLDELLIATDLNYAALLVVSEYGTAPVHTEADPDPQAMHGALVAAGRGSSAWRGKNMVHLTEVPSALRALLDLPPGESHK